MVGFYLCIELNGEVESALTELIFVVEFGAVVAEEVDLLIAEHLLGGGVDGGDHSRFVGDDDAEGRAGDDGFVEAERPCEVFLVLMAGGDVGDRGCDSVGELDDLNLMACGPASGQEGGAGYLDEGGFSGLDDTFVPLEELVGAKRGEDLVEIFAKDLIARSQ